MNRFFIKRILIVSLIVDSLFLLAFTNLPEITSRKPQASEYSFNNPAGCLTQAPTSVDEMLENVQSILGEDFDLSNRQEYYIWNAYQGVYINAVEDAFIREYLLSYANSPLTYLADPAVSAFQASGFVVYLRNIDGNTRLLAIPMVEGIMDSIWADYISLYWQGTTALPENNSIIPVRKKLPCQWVVDAGYVAADTLTAMINLNWNIPDYLSAGTAYLTSGCTSTYDMAATIVNQDGSVATGDGSMMCGPLAWAITSDANSFPYRVGYWNENPSGFVGTNPRYYTSPWNQFDPETFDLTSHADDVNIHGYDFQQFGNLYQGDIIFTYGDAFYTKDSQSFHHIFMITDIGSDNSRNSVSNLVRNFPYSDCSIEHIPTYTPGDQDNGYLNFEWAGNGFGETGDHGFDVFRWKWITYHAEGNARDYTVRIGDTLETIAFDWKISPFRIADWNGLALDSQLTVGQIISLPALTTAEQFH